MDWKPWAMRLGTVAVAASTYALAALVLKGTDAQGPVMALAGMVAGLLLPQVAKVPGA